MCYIGIHWVEHFTVSSFLLQTCAVINGNYIFLHILYIQGLAVFPTCLLITVSNRIILYMLLQAQKHLQNHQWRSWTSLLVHLFVLLSATTDGKHVLFLELNLSYKSKASFSFVMSCHVHNSTLSKQTPCQKDSVTMPPPAFHCKMCKFKIITMVLPCQQGFWLQ